MRYFHKRHGNKSGLTLGAGELWTGDQIGSNESFLNRLRQQNYRAGDTPNPSTDFFAFL